jgi:hypothetical protein
VTAEPAAAAVPSDADQGRSALFRRNLRSAPAVYAMLLGGGGAFLLGAYLQDPRVWAGGPAAIIALVVLIAFRSADRRAELDFFVALARSLKLDYLAHGGLPPLTPLLGAGDRRRLEHMMTGTLDPDRPDVPLTLAHYTYEIRRTYRDDDATQIHRWEPHHFTVCVFDVEQVVSRFRGVFVRRRRGVFDSVEGGDWLSRLDPVREELESTEFTEAYDLYVARDQDPLAVRQLFSPSLLDWFARHPLHPGMELRAGTLVIFLPGHVEEAGKLTWLLDGAREVAQRVLKDGEEAAAVA